MFEDDVKHSFHIDALRDKVKKAFDKPDGTEDKFNVDKLYANNFSWNAISDVVIKEGDDKAPLKAMHRKGAGEDFSGQTLIGAQYAGRDFKNADFSGCDLRDSDFKNANLEGVDFSSADLSGADLSGANLNYAVFSSATLKGTNFTGAKMNGVTLKDADIEDAILLDVEMDQIALQELQELVEFLAMYYPHKLNLKRINLTLLDLSKIDLTQLDLRGVDFTGCNFTGVNIFELDLSECIISQAQIEQALGRPVTPKELKEILAPKKKKRKLKGLDLTEFFFSVGKAGVWDASKHPGVRIDDIMHAGKKLYNMFLKRQDSDEEILAKFHNRALKSQEAKAEEKKERMRLQLEEKKMELRRERDMEEYEKNKRSSEIKEHEKMKQEELKKAIEKRKMREQMYAGTYGEGRGGR
ncbi:MAG: pentapeptide repeat-containing protein [Alphaproteobacteria bacterium]|nr:pentapeptide repeat-containing protein [Alphaproteobacteria bacterium]